MFKNISTPSLFGLLAVAVLVAILAGCAGTRAAYDSAETLEAKAYVVTEHYAVLVREAANMASEPGFPRESITRLQAADERARPFILELREASQNYTALRSPENAAALQTALDRAVVQVSALITAIRNR